MKVGTDGVLLGAWVSLSGNENHILDVGTGTGVIALMLAQRTEKSVIVGIDIDEGSVKDANSNFKASPWGGRMAAFQKDFTSMEPFPYELIVSNPPYFINSLKAPDARRSDARHTDTLPYEALACNAEKMMAQEGRLAVILPYEESQIFISNASSFGLYINRICRVRTTPEREFKRVMMEFSRIKKEPLEEELIIQAGEEFTSQYKTLTADFYLKF